MDLFRIVKLEKVLSWTLYSPYEFKMALSNLFSSLNTNNQNIPASHGRTVPADALCHHFFAEQRNVQQLLYNTTKRLNTQSSSLQAFRNIMKQDDLPVEELSQNKPAAVMLLFQDLYFHCFGHSQYTLDQFEVGTENLWILLNHCYKLPHLRPLTAFYIFMQYKSVGARFFKDKFQQLPNLVNDPTHYYASIYPLLRHHAALFPREDAKKDCYLMEQLIYSTSSGTFFMEFWSHIQPSTVKITDYKRDLHKICFSEDPYVLLTLSPYMPIPNYKVIDEDLYAASTYLESCFVPLCPEKKFEKYRNNLWEIITVYKNIMHVSSAVCFKDIIDVLNYAFAKVCEPKNYFHAIMELPPSQPYKTCLRWICSIMYPDIFKESMTLEEMIDLLKRKKVFYAVDLNLTAFLRVTRYVPQGGLEVYDSNLAFLCDALQELFESDKILLYSAFGLKRISPQPINHASYKIANKICHALYRDWDANATHGFCNVILSVAQKNIEQDQYFFDSLCVGCIDRNSSIIRHTLSQPDLSTDNIYMTLFQFSKSIISDIRKDAYKALDHLIELNDPDILYFAYRILDQCFDSASWDIRTRFWAFLYDTADNFYPFRSNTPRKKQNAKHQNDELFENESVGKV